MGINKDLGLPFGDGMERTLIAFDVDGTLIGENESIVHSKMVRLLNTFASIKWKNADVVVWSGGGAKYAETIVRRLMLPGYFPLIKFHSKLEYKELRKKYTKIIAFDDIQDTRLGDINLIVRNK